MTLRMPRDETASSGIETVARSATEQSVGRVGRRLVGEGGLRGRGRVRCGRRARCDRLKSRGSDGARRPASAEPSARLTA